MRRSVEQFEVSGHTSFKGSNTLSERYPKRANAVRRKGKMDEVEKQSGEEEELAKAVRQCEREERRD